MTSKAVLGLFLALGVATKAELTVFDSLSDHQLMNFADASADFGKRIPDEGMMIKITTAHPIHACSDLLPGPDMSHVGHRVKPAVLISRYGGCNFEDKVRRAQNANFSVAIIFDPKSDRLLSMAGSDDSLIPSVFIGRHDAQMIRSKYVYENDKLVFFIITDDDNFNINDYILPFVVVCGICILVMLGIVVYKCIQDARRTRRHRLPRSALRKIPIVKFKEGDPYETCAVCLDDFTVGEKLRVLPCDHGYHAKCIDPWLLKTKRICPQCRKKVFPNSPEDGPGSSDEETDERSALLPRNPQPVGPAPGPSRVRPGTSRGRVDPRGGRASANTRGRTTSNNPLSSVAAAMASALPGNHERSESTERLIEDPPRQGDTVRSRPYVDHPQGASNIQVEDEVEDLATVPRIEIVTAVETHRPPRGEDHTNDEEEQERTSSSPLISPRAVTESDDDDNAIA